MFPTYIAGGPKKNTDARVQETDTNVTNTCSGLW